MVPPKTSMRGLASCHGFAVIAANGPVGTIETPLFTGAATEPDYLIIRTTAAIEGAFRVVPTALVENVDPLGHQIFLNADHNTIASLPEYLPLER
jgi:hypothetical protein